jgi:hypothetical protein
MGRRPEGANGRAAGGRCGRGFAEVKALFVTLDAKRFGAMLEKAEAAIDGPR